MKKIRIWLKELSYEFLVSVGALGWLPPPVRASPRVFPPQRISSDLFPSLVPHWSPRRIWLYIVVYHFMNTIKSMKLN